MRDARRGWFWLALAGVFALALAVRVGVTVLFVGLEAPPSASANPDQLDYEAFAWRVSQGEGYTLDTPGSVGTPGTPTSRRPPGTSFVLAPVYGLFGRSFAAARVWMCILSAGTCVACGVLGAMCFGRRVGVVAAVGLALYPGHFYYAMHMLSETPYAWWLTLAAIATLVSVRRVSMSWATIAGLLWAAALLTRPQVLLLPLFVLPLTLVVQRPLRRILVTTTIACVVALAPWVIRNALVMDRVCLTTGFGHVMWGAHNDQTFTDPQWQGRWVATSVLLKNAPFKGTSGDISGGTSGGTSGGGGGGGDEVALDQHAMVQAKRQIREHLWELPRLTLMKLVRFVEPIHDTPNARTRLAFTVGWGVAALLLLPGVILAWRRNRTASLVLQLPILATVAMTLLTYGLDRFRDCAAPLFVPIAAVAAVALLDAARRMTAFTTSIPASPPALTKI